ncbi:ATP-binding protein [Alcanivorax sp.]|uniref:BbrUII/HgiDII family restriction enzyme n=1 Tax=Alcanivorax sp. TaxID=1872427 RepID=UPI0025BDA709|nr:ATP-binding protein [Alcanivorax sp.]
MSNYQIEIDLNVLNHLGIGLYTNTPAVLTEIVANSWDADANNVEIEIEPENDRIVIRDDGHGMNESDLQNKFLKVGYARREHGEAITIAKRQCMGRKGIGKLAMFSLASEIHVVSRVSGGEKVGFVINVDDLKKEISNNNEYSPSSIDDVDDYDLEGKGTIIILKKLNSSINRSENFLRRRIARRFSVIGEANDFYVKINGQNVRIEDRGFYNDIQLLWTFGNAEKKVKGLCGKHVRHHHFDGILPVSGERVDGFIGGVFKPEMLKREDDNNNTVTVMANGRVFVEDLQKSIDDSKVFNSYLVGELEVDFFDDNKKQDMAVSSRQGVIENDDRYKELLSYIKTRLSEIASNWTDWRREIGGEAVVEEYPKVTEWLDTLSPSHREKAKKLVGRVNSMRFSGGEEEQKAQKKEVIKHQILAFEKMKIRDNIDDLKNIDIELGAEKFRGILVSIEDIEASMQHDILDQRLAVIKKLNGHSNDAVKERIVQEHIYKHLWLIDPSWDHVETSKAIESTVTEYLRKACPDTTEGARFDIGYKTTAGRYLVIELKKPGLSVNFNKLADQGEKYKLALGKYFEENPGSCPSHGQIPSIDIIFLVDKSPISANSDQRKMQEGRLNTFNGKILTYRDLVNKAQSAYEAHIQVLNKVDRLRRITDGL